MITLYNIRPKGFNIGNDAIFIGLQYFLYQTFGELINIISLPATSRYESYAKAGLSSKTIYEINHFADGVIIGGGNLYENGELDVNLDALKALEVPLMLFSLSRGRIYNRYSELVDRTDVMPDRIIKALNDKAFVSLVRDKATYDYMRALGYDNVRLGGCPTIFLNRMQYRLPNVNPELYNSAFISIRNPSLMNVPLHKQAQVRGDIHQIIELLDKNGYKDIKLLCHDLRDIEFASSFTDIEFIYTGDVYVYLNIIRSCALNVSYRVHASLPSFSFGIPAINISYDERASSMMDTIGMNQWNIDMMKTDDVPSAVLQRLKNRVELETIKKGNVLLWQNLENTLNQSFQEFAHEILNNKHT